tara:strand:+ start:5742 stop:6179 length:438 start_codon:yes stop_codon:yes gene_type:complete
MLKLTKKEIFKLNKNLNLQDVVNDIADATVQDIISGIENSTDINNRPFKRLKPATIKAKKRKGSKTPTKPLLDEGKMKNVYVKKRATQSSKRATISVNQRDRAVPSIVHNEGLDPMPKREWFGYSKRMDKKANIIAKEHIRNALK